MRYDGSIHFDRPLTYAQASTLLPHIPPIAKINSDGKSITIKGEAEEIEKDLIAIIHDFSSLRIRITGLITAYDGNNRMYDLVVIKSQLKKSNNDGITTILP